MAAPVSSSSSAMDSSYEAQELRSLLLSSNSQADILNSCRAVETFIQTHNANQCRHFYVVCFPVLLRRMFGFEDFSQHFVGGGWIAQACDYSANAVLNLLSPSGALFCSMLAADEQNLVRYIFPSERLPAWIRPILRSDRGVYVLSELCPALFKGRLKEDGANGAELFQVQLNIFEYFMFWFAYYAVCKDNSNETEIESNEFSKFGGRRVSKFRWTPSLPGLYPSHGRGSLGKLNSRPYWHLANLYLQAFVPISDLDSSALPFGASPSPYLHHLFAEGRSVFSRAEFVVNTFVQFWLVDGDSSPIPLPICQSLNISLPFDSGCCRYVPPSADHIDAIKILVNYFNISLQAPQDEINPFQSDLKWRRASQTDIVVPGSFASSSGTAGVLTPWSQLLQRPLYRFISRAFLYWPIGASVKKLAFIIDLWLDYLEPWNGVIERQPMLVSEDVYFEAENKMLRDPARALSPLSGALLLKQKAGTGSGGSPVGKSMDENKDDSRYNEQWQNYVLANYPFYTTLFVHFLAFANKFVHIDTEAVLQMTHKVLNFLASSWELTSLLRRVEFVYNNVVSGSASHSFDNLHKFVPAIREQMQDWENNSFNFEKESEIIVSSPQKGAPVLQLFNATEYGGHQILKLFILRAEAWIQTSSGEKIQSSLQSLESLKALMIKIFGSFEIGPCNEMVSRYVSESRKLSGLGRHTWADVKYKGDWMRRPIGNSEVAWLARLLVWFSDWLNQRLGLDDQVSTVFGDNNRGANSFDSTNISQPTFADITLNDEVSIVDCLSDWTTWTNLFSVVLSCFMCYSLSLFQAAQGLLRRNGWRINLRILAEKKVL
ncbi:hypothetical protein KI387_012084, partial [Taxus chinensis]